MPKNSPRRTSKGLLAISYIEKMPNSTNTAIAKALAKDYPNDFATVEHARCSIRVVKGQSGDLHRAKSYTDVRQKIKQLKKDLPKGESERIESYILPKSCTRILVLSDCHIPYQDDDALFAALQYGIDKEVNCIYLNGDTIDMYQLSRHEKNPTNRSFSYELDCVRTFLKGLRDIFPNAHIVYKIGNHDFRYEKYIMQNAPHLLGIDALKLCELLNFTELRIQEVKSMQWAYAGKLPILHGHELPTKSGGVNPARTVQLKLNKQGIVGHFHRETRSNGKQFDDKPYTTYSSGCLCDLNPAYMPINDWTHGFTYVEINPKTGNYYVHQKTIVDGAIY
jgi:predicted phosphodiesterase